MNSRVLICLGLFVLSSWSCNFQSKDPKAEVLDEVSVAISNQENERTKAVEPSVFLHPIVLDEEKVIKAVYPEYFNDVFDTELAELVGADYVRDEFSPGDRHTIEEVSGYSLPDGQSLVLLHWAPINGPGSNVTEVIVIETTNEEIKVVAINDKASRIVYGGGTLGAELPKPDSFYSISEGNPAFGISQIMQHSPSDSFSEEVYVMEVNGGTIHQVFDYRASVGHNSFKLKDELNTKSLDLIQFGTMIPNHVFRTNIEEAESKLEFAPNRTNGHLDFILKKETYYLSDELNEIRYEFTETLFQYDGSVYVEGGRVSS